MPIRYSGTRSAEAPGTAASPTGLAVAGIGNASTKGASREGSTFGTTGGAALSMTCAKARDDTAPAARSAESLRKLRRDVTLLMYGRNREFSKGTGDSRAL